MTTPLDDTLNRLDFVWDTTAVNGRTTKNQCAEQNNPIVKLEEYFAFLEDVMPAESIKKSDQSRVAVVFTL